MSVEPAESTLTTPRSAKAQPCFDSIIGVPNHFIMMLARFHAIGHLDSVVLSFLFTRQKNALACCVLCARGRPSRHHTT